MIACGICGHRLATWESYVIGSELVPHVALSPRWGPSGDHWQRKARTHRWNVMSGGGLPDDVIFRPEGGIALRSPVKLKCPVQACGFVTTTPRSP